MSKALDSALRAVARMRGDSDASTAELLQLLAAALSNMAGEVTETEGTDWDRWRH